MNIDLSGKHAMVCGSTQGIGKAIAIELALLGADVTLVARDEKKLLQVKKELSVKMGQKHDCIHADFFFPAELQLKAERYIRNCLLKWGKSTIAFTQIFFSLLNFS